MSGWAVERLSHLEASGRHGSGEADESIGLPADATLLRWVRTAGRHNALGARQTSSRGGARKAVRVSPSDELGRVGWQGNALNGETPRATAVCNKTAGAREDQALKGLRKAEGGWLPGRNQADLPTRVCLIAGGAQNLMGGARVSGRFGVQRCRAAPGGSLEKVRSL